MGDNSGTRLHQVLTELKKYRNLKIKNALVSTFKYNESPDINAYYAYSDLLTLVNQTKQDLSTLANNSLFLNTINQIENALALGPLSLESPAHQLIIKYDNLLAHLPFCADALSRYKTDDISISNEELSNLIKELELFEESIFLSDIPNELKEFIFEHTRDIQKAITQFKIKGPMGLKRAMESSLGAILVNKELVSNDENSKSAAKRFFDLLGRINLLINLGKESYPLLEPLFHHVLHN